MRKHLALLGEEHIHPKYLKRIVNALRVSTDVPRCDSHLFTIPLESSLGAGALDGLGFFALWDSLKTSLPDVCAKSFDEYPPNDFYLPGAILTSLLNPDEFEAFVENLFDYFAGIDEQLLELVVSAQEPLALWWEADRSETLVRICGHSRSFRDWLTQQ